MHRFRFRASPASLVRGRENPGYGTGKGGVRISRVAPGAWLVVVVLHLAVGRSNAGGVCTCPGGCDDGIDCTYDECICLPGPTCDCHCENHDACGSSGCTMRYCDHGSGYCVTTGTCDDLNACTLDSCDETSTCQHENTCQPIYVGCYTGTCDPATGCHYTPIECSDGDACNGLEYCELDVGCRPGTPPDCDDHNACTRDSCDPATGCDHEYTCDDGNICNGVEDCDRDIGCLPGTPLDCSTENVCWNPHCDPHDGCYWTPVSGRACDDHDACTTGDTCENGYCKGGPRLVCPNEDDGDYCNGYEYCDHQRGCVAVPPPECDDHNPCTDDRCDPVAGCSHGCFASFADGPELPKPDDRTFVNSDGAVLGPGLNPLTIYVTRYAGPTTISGTLVHAVHLVSDKLAAQDAMLRIVAFGVQPDKQYAVSFNALALGVLEPAGCDWSVTTFTVPFNSVRFPASRGSGGGGPPGQPNTVTISVDGTPACLKIKGMSEWHCRAAMGFCGHRITVRAGFAG